MEEKKRIRFIDSHYHTLFSIADGDSIEIGYPECKEKEERKEAVKGEKKTGTTRMERSRR